MNKPDRRAYEQTRYFRNMADPEKRETLRIRSFTRTRAKRAGRNTCVVCGSEEADAHHPDYSRPLRVVWLCRPHHRQLHTTMTQAEVAIIEAMSVDIGGKDIGVAQIANAQKTHCPRGHELTGANLYFDPKRNARACRACRDLAGRRYRAKQAERE